jgi:type II secretory pathway component GspD/PulD (secretin)
MVRIFTRYILFFLCLIAHGLIANLYAGSTSTGVTTNSIYYDKNTRLFTINLVKANVLDVLKELAELSATKFEVSKNPNASNISLKVERLPLEKVLFRLFRSQSYIITITKDKTNNKQIVKIRLLPRSATKARSVGKVTIDRMIDPGMDSATIDQVVEVYGQANDNHFKNETSIVLPSGVNDPALSHRENIVGNVQSENREGSGSADARYGYQNSISDPALGVMN